MNTDSSPQWAQPFIPAWLDEADMNPFEFRIVCHLLREGKAFSIESGANIGEMCGISRATVLRSLASLEAKGYVLILRVPGEANEYRVLVG